MLDSIIERFKQRRAERLAQRGYNIKKKQYRKSDGEIKVSKKELLKDIEHFDEPEEESTEEAADFSEVPAAQSDAVSAADAPAKAITSVTLQYTSTKYSSKKKKPAAYNIKCRRRFRIDVT